MTRMDYAVLKGFLLAIVLALPAQTAWAQGPTIEPGTPSTPGGGDSRLGPSPGEVGGPRGDNEIVRQYRDTLVRHRRDMLGLNTAVGQRILP